MYKYKIVFKSGETVVIDCGTYQLAFVYDNATRASYLKAYDCFECDASLVLYYVKVN